MIVEFALILTPLLLLVVGIVQLGMAISFWQDQQRLAAAGARIAIVNCGGTSSWCSPSLESHLASQTLSNGNNPTATVCFESKSGNGGTRAQAGDSVTVQLTAPFKLVPLFKVGTITLSATTTMRMEQEATHAGIASEPVCP